MTLQIFGYIELEAITTFDQHIEPPTPQELQNALNELKKKEDENNYNSNNYG